MVGAITGATGLMAATDTDAMAAIMVAATMAAIMAVTTISDWFSGGWQQERLSAARLLNQGIMISPTTMRSHNTMATRMLAGATPGIVPTGPMTIRFSPTTALDGNV